MAEWNATQQVFYTIRLIVSGLVKGRAAWAKWNSVSCTVVLQCFTVLIQRLRSSVLPGGRLLDFEGCCGGRFRDF